MKMQKLFLNQRSMSGKMRIQSFPWFFPPPITRCREGSLYGRDFLGVRVYSFCFWILLLTSTLVSKLWLSSKQQKFYLFSKSSLSHKKKKKTYKQQPSLPPLMRLLVKIRFPIPIYSLIYSLISFGNSCLKVKVWHLPQVVLKQNLQRLS